MNGLQNGLMYSDNIVSSSPWIEFSDNSTIVGWGTPTKQILYKVVGKIAYILFNITGTSNSTSTTFTVPFPSAYPSNTTTVSYGVNSGTANLFDAILPTNSTLVTCLRWSAITTRATWTSSGTKTITGQFFYEIY